MLIGTFWCAVTTIQATILTRLRMAKVQFSKKLEASLFKKYRLNNGGVVDNNNNNNNGDSTEKLKKDKRVFLSSFFFINSVLYDLLIFQDTYVILFRPNF